MCHWMGSAIRLPREGIDLGSCDLHLVAGVDAFPDDVLSSDFQSKIDGLLQEFTTRGRIDRFVRTNWTALHRVTRIPVKAFVDPVRYPRIHARNTDGSTGLANFFPEEVNVHNIGSNHGLLSKLRGAFDAHNALPPQDQVYQIIVADSNIFQRILKVGFDFFFHLLFRFININDFNLCFSFNSMHRMWAERPSNASCCHCSGPGTLISWPAPSCGGTSPTSWGPCSITFIQAANTFSSKAN